MATSGGDLGGSFPSVGLSGLLLNHRSIGDYVIPAHMEGIVVKLVYNNAGRYIFTV